MPVTNIKPQGEFNFALNKLCSWLLGEKLDGEVIITIRGIPIQIPEGVKLTKPKLAVVAAALLQLSADDTNWGVSGKQPQSDRISSLVCEIIRECREDRHAVFTVHDGWIEYRMKTHSGSSPLCGNPVHTEIAALCKCLAVTSYEILNAVRGTCHA